MTSMRVLAIALPLALALTGCAAGGDNLSPAPASQASGEEKTGASRNGEAQDPAVYASDSTNVFAGTVENIMGHEKRGIVPESQVRVRVSENLKGFVPGTVIVNLYNSLMEAPEGYVEENQHDSPAGVRVHEGNDYVFYTRFNEESGWFTVSNPIMIQELSSSHARSARGTDAIGRARELIAQRKPVVHPDGSVMPVEEALSVEADDLPAQPSVSTSPIEPSAPSPTEAQTPTDTGGG